MSKTYGDREVLKAVDLEVLAGEMLAITGPSGSGKSTLLHCLATIVQPDAGEITFGGLQLSRLAEARRSEMRRTCFGIMFQFGQLVPELSAAENVALPLLLRGMRRGEAIARATAVLDRFGVAEFAPARPSALSGGQAQRVAMARAVATDPTILFADEPTGALDSNSGARVLDELVALARAGTAVVMVTHDPAAASRADRVVELRDGMLEAPA
ncbi:ABC transporter ATP-binding protein [Nocardioides marmorisolisilvae]|uniref:ABC transporter ATP-binding protein n=1 Tax=Nocardioides marmorisolisilvae TaxID=1542737 RepID=UPI001FE9F7CF|nr:ABC transporter ATP-binding protein [Nocardioides marmorisolisilvae]